MKRTAIRASFLVTAALTVLVGCQPEVKPPPPPSPPPQILGFTASAPQVDVGGSVTLSWETEGAARLELKDADKGVVSITDNTAPSGSVAVTLTESALFVLTAENDRGVRVSAAVSVKVDTGAERVLFVASPGRIDAGASAVLTWSAPGAKSVSLADAQGNAIGLGTQRETGSVSVTPAITTTYTLTVDGAAHDAEVIVGASVDAFVATPSSAVAGQPLVLSWKTTGAQQVSISSPLEGVLHTETDAAKITDGSYAFAVPETVHPAAALTFVITAHGADELTSKTTSLTVYVAGAPKVVDFEVPPYAREGGTFTVSWETTGADIVELLKNGVVIYRAPLSDTDLGSYELPTPPADAQYQLRAKDSRGGTDLSEIFTVNPVNLPSVIAFTATPQPGIANGGEAVTLTWDVPFARRVTIVAKDQYTLTEVKGVTAETGSVIAYPNKDTEYLLTADNGIGDEVPPASQQVTVTTPAKLVYSPSGAVPAGTPVTVTGTTIPNSGQIIGLPNVVHNAPDAAFIDIAATGTDVNYSGPDTTGIVITLPQPFTTVIYGVPYTGTQVSMTNNGWLKFGSTAYHGYDNPTGLPGTGLEPLAIAPLWTDLYDNATSEMFWQLDTVGSEQRLILQWDKFEYDPVAGSEITVQAQIYSSGKIVFAYKTLQGWNSPVYAIGVVNQNETDALVGTVQPAEGDTFTFFGPVTPPATITATAVPFKVRVLIPPEGFIEIETTMQVVPPNQFAITEANVNPTVADGQWIEVTNTSSTDWDLDGWTLDLGGGATHTLTGPLVLPANGSIVLAQAAGANDGLSTAYTWGTAQTIAPGASVALGMFGVDYTRMSLGAGTVPSGHSIQRGALPAAMLKKSGITEAVCGAASASTYGANGQLGTPGAANTSCPGYTYAGTITGAFEPLAMTGGTKILQSGGSNESIDEVTLPSPIRFGGIEYSTVWVSTNGFITLQPLTCKSTTDCYFDNASSITSTYMLPVGAIAPFWDDLDLNATGGIYWARRTPNLAPNDGYTVISWENAKKDISGTYDYNFQIKFFDTGTVEFHFGTMYGSTASYALGSSSTTWWEIPSGGAAFSVNINSSSPGILPNTGRRLAAQ